MDFYKSNTTSSNHSSNSHSNRSSVSSSSSKSNGGTTYNLEYCTSSSSLSPPILPYDKNATSMITKTPMPSTYRRLLPSSSSSSAKSIVIVPIDDEVIISSSDGSQSSVSSSTMASLLYSSSQKVAKRKRKASITLETKESDLGFEPPSAKRQQRVPSLYQSDPGSIVSSGYTSSPDAELEQVIDTRSSSDCLSPAIEFDVAAHEDIPDSPDSLQHENEYDLDDEDEEEIVSGTSSPSVYSITSSNLNTNTNSRLHTNSPHHHGERTPATHSEMHHSDCNSTSGENEQSNDDFLHAAYYCMTPAAETDPPRQCPLPALSWANAQDVWQLMCKKDELESGLRNTTMLEHHPGLQPRMRAILLDWLIEVCEVYKLHRETYYLAVDYLDRYLSAQKRVQKTHLQLIGITCLFVAAKVEEIYPPKIGEFAYVTDGACQESDILQHEILLLQALDWNINPVTPMSWLGIYMQLNVNNRTPASFSNTKISKENIVKNEMASSSAVSTSAVTPTSTLALIDDAFIYPQFSGMEFVQTAQLLDLCSLDVGIANFPYSVIAAAAISHTFNRETALRSSGFDWHTLETCSRWMEPFFHVVRKESKYLQLLEQNEQLTTKFGLGHICPNIITDDSHIMQTHTTTMAMFDRACLLQEQYLTVAAKIKQEASPGTALICPEGLLTPPASSRKPLDSLDEAADEGNDDNDTDSETAVVSVSAETTATAGEDAANIIGKTSS